MIGCLHKHKVPHSYEQLKSQ